VWAKHSKEISTLNRLLAAGLRYLYTGDNNRRDMHTFSIGPGAAV
jgi:hypothetical protein